MTIVKTLITIARRAWTISNDQSSALPNPSIVTQVLPYLHGIQTHPSHNAQNRDGTTRHTRPLQHKMR
jgi:predicted Ser/Thr protein kinase